MVGDVRGWLVIALISVGCFFLTVGTIGLLRLPNVYNRMHATSKPTTLGTAAIFLAGFVSFGPGGYGLPSLVGIFFLFLTVPTGAHMISRSAQRIGVPFLGGVTWPGRPEDESREDRSGADDESSAPERSISSGSSGDGSPPSDSSEDRSPPSDSSEDRSLPDGSSDEREKRS